MGTTIGAETCCWAEEIPDWLGRLGITCITPTSLLIDYRSVPQVRRYLKLASTVSQ